MNRIIFIILALCLGNIAQAQNANRSGFFIEAGIGGLTGTTPISTLYIDGIHAMAEHATGVGANLNIGYRVKISNHFAIDFRGGAMAPVKSISSIHTFKIMPGIRYTSKEFYKNISFYAGVALGATLNRYGVYGYLHNFITDVENIDDLITVGEKLDPDKIIYRTPGSKSTFGLGAFISIGLNLSSNIYTGVYYEHNHPNGYDRPENYNNRKKYRWGMVGALIGYRF